MRHPEHAPKTTQQRRMMYVAGIGLLLTIVIMWLLWSENSDTLLTAALESKNEAEQIQLLKQSVAAAGGHFPKAEIELCLVLAGAENWTEASTALTRLDRTQCSAADLLAYAKLSVHAEQWDTAELALTSIQDASHHDEERLSLLCHLYAGMNRHKELIETAGELTKIAPKTTRWWLQLAEIYAQKENTLAVIQTFQAALKSPIPVADTAWVRCRLLECCIDAGDATLAREQFQLLRQANDADPRINIWEARLCHLEGRPAEALAAINHASVRIKEIPEALRLRGILYFELGQFEPAISDLTQAMLKSPDDEIACFKLSEAWRRWGHQRSDSVFIEQSVKYHQQYQVIHSRNLQKKPDM